MKLIQYSFSVVFFITAFFNLVQAVSISKFNPLSGPIGTTVAITGTGFSTNAGSNVVTFNGIKAVVLQATATELLIVVPAGPTYTKIMVSVDTLMALSELPFKVTTSDNCYGFPGIQQIKSGTGPTEVTTGDINGDGKLDIVAANTDNSSVSIFFNNTNGSFSGSFEFPAGNFPKTVKVADFNRDGKQDIIAGGNSSYSFLAGTNSTDPSPKNTFPLNGSPISTALSDYNRDGNLDIAFLLSVSPQPVIAILLGNGNGTFTLKASLEVIFAENLSVGDFNNDGMSDLVTANSQGNNIHVFLGNGDGTFGAKTTYVSASTPRAVCVADFNNDGNQDIAAVSYAAGKFSIFLGTGNGSFADKTDYAAGASGVSIAAADLNGDGKMDLVTGNEKANLITIITGKGDGTFNEIAGLYGGSNNKSIAIGDFNKDGKADLAIANFGSNQVGIMLNKCPVTTGIAEELEKTETIITVIQDELKISGNGEFFVEIFSMQGKSIASFNGINERSFNVSKMKSGVYLVSLYGATGITKSKIVIP